jgi:hypothetical protein
MRTYLVKAWSLDPEACDYYTVKAYSEEEAVNIGKTRLMEHTTPWPRAVKAKVITELTPEARVSIKPR